ncbi:MAG TPA: DUF1572 family protein [Vicinamibacterales bacterium]|jgi:hypothetical protein
MSTSTADLATAQLKDIVRTFKNYKSLGDAAIARTPDEHLHTELDPQSNSVAIIAKHVGGNLRSRFQDFLTSDGEKADRNRDGEFEMTERASREEITAWWERGWTTVLGSLEALTPADLERTVKIRGEGFLVVEALNRSVTHTAYHVGQLVYLARHFAGPAWKSLSIPKGQSAKAAVGDFKTKGIARP